MSADDTMSAASVAQNSGTRAIAKKNATVAIGPVGDRCQFLGPDYKDCFVRVRGDELLCDFQTKQETGARCGNIETGSLGRADLFLNKARGSGKQHVRRGCRHNNEIDLFWRNLGLFDRL